MMGKKSSVEVRAEIERLSREGKTQREIAARASLCIDTVRTIQRALGLRRPRAAMRTRGPLSLQEKKEIARLYKKGWLITSIGKRMRLTRGTVARHIKRMALAPPGLPEEKLLSMRRSGLFTQRQIARRLKLSYRRTFRFFRSHGYARPRCRRLTAADIVAIDAAILQRNASASAIA